MINKVNNEVIKMPNTGIVKYHVKLKFDVDGLVEKADIIGAIFGTEQSTMLRHAEINNTVCIINSAQVLPLVKPAPYF